MAVLSVDPYEFFPEPPLRLVSTVSALRVAAAGAVELTAFCDTYTCLHGQTKKDNPFWPGRFEVQPVAVIWMHEKPT